MVQKQYGALCKAPGELRRVAKLLAEASPTTRRCKECELPSHLPLKFQVWYGVGRHLSSNTPALACRHKPLQTLFHGLFHSSPTRRPSRAHGILSVS